MTRVLVTGGAGFIGSNFVHYLHHKYPDYQIAVLDSLTYAGNLRNLESLLNSVTGSDRVSFVRMDICDAAVAEAMSGTDLVVHFAAESHVDRSIEDASAFVRTNVDGTWNLVEAARKNQVRRFLHVSTDEVYGSLDASGRFTETTPLMPTSPYAATKAASDLLVQAAIRTHGFPAIITRCSNNYGPYQFPEKLMPLMIAQALAGEALPVYGDGMQVRDWIHVADHCRALDLVLHGGREDEVYNIGGDAERTNLDVVRTILRTLGKPETLIRHVTDRKAHDRRYAMDSSKLQQELGWQPQWTFEAGLADTIRWYQQNEAWLAETRSGDYRNYFERHYMQRAKTFA